MMRKYKRSVALLACAVLPAFALMGCPPPGGNGNGDGEGKVYTMFTADNAPGKSLVEAVLSDKQGPVDVADVESLIVTVTEIRLRHDSGLEEVVFAGALDVELVNLVGISELLSEATVAAGTYDRVELSITNPQLTRFSLPGEVFTEEDIQLTANERLFVNTQFTVPANQNSLLILDFGGMHLVEQGNGGYTLTPQLAADVSVQPADVILNAEIVAVDLTAETVTVALTTGDGELVVVFADADIFLVADAETPTGLPADLLVGVEVEVMGELQVDGTVVATEVRLLS